MFSAATKHLFSGVAAVKSLEVTNTITVGTNPQNVVFNRSGTKAYVANRALINNSTISVIDTATETVSTSFRTNFSSTDFYPAWLVASPTEDKIFCVCDSGVLEISTVTDSITRQTSAGISSRWHGSISPDGSKLYVGGYGNDWVVVISTSSMSWTSTFQNAASAWSTCPHPNGTKLYCLNYTQNSVTVVNASNGSLITTISVANTPIPAGFSPDGASLYVSRRSSSGGLVDVINTSTDTVVSTITTNLTNPVWGAVASDGKLFVGDQENRGAGNTGRMAVMTGTPYPSTVFKTITGLGNQVSGMSISPDGKKLYAASNNSNTVSVIAT